MGQRSNIVLYELEESGSGIKAGTWESGIMDDSIFVGMEVLKIEMVFDQ